MAAIRLEKVEQGETQIKNVPIAVTPEGFWCYPSPVAFQKTLKSNTVNKPKPSPPLLKSNFPKKHTHVTEEKPISTTLRSVIATHDQQSLGRPNNGAHVVQETASRQKIENLPRKVAIEFGEPGTSDIKVILLGTQGFCVKLGLHKYVLVENSTLFANKISEKESGFSCLEIEDCEDIEIYVETVGLMYSKDMKQQLIKQSVPRVLRVLKVAELLGFNSCIQSSLDYLEAVPWVGEEEEKVISSVLKLKHEGIGVAPVLKRVISNVSDPPKETFSHIIELVLESNKGKGQLEMKSIVLKLLREQNGAGIADDFNEIVYSSCRYRLDSLLSLFRQAAEPEFSDKPEKELVTKQIAAEADNICWLLDILAERQTAEEFAVTWANQNELTLLHEKIPVMCRYHISRITSRLFVGIGQGEVLPPKEIRLLVLRKWLQPLIGDYNWLQHGCRSFDKKLVEEGIGRTILTLPLEDQQSILLSWLASFLKVGDKCPNLQRAFEVWWRRFFIRPCADTLGNDLLQTDRSKTSTSK